MESYDLQINPGVVPLVIHVSQFDTDRDYTFTPYKGPEKWPYQTGSRCVIEATKADGYVVIDTATYNSDGTVYYKLASQLTTAAGDTAMKIRFITSSNLTLATCQITLAVDLAGIHTAARLSGSDVELLENDIITLNGKIKIAEDSAIAAKASATNASSSASVAAESAKIAQSAEAHVTAAEEKAIAAAEAAALSETHAATSESNAKASKEAAELAESHAATSESHAATSEAHAATSEAKAELSESWAVGGTGKREGEDTNNSKYWCEQAQGAVAGVASFNGRHGAVTPQSGDYSYDQISNTPSAATSEADGLMSSADKTKLDGIAEGATKVSIDSDVTEGSANAVSGGGVFTALSALHTPVRLGIRTLTAGETSLSWTSDAITDTCIIEPSCSVNGVAPTAQEQSGTTYTVTFDARSDDMQVDVVVIQ